MKIKFKLNRHQLEVWISCLESCWMESSNESPPLVKMVFHALSKLMHKLQSENLMRKSDYNFSVDSVEALAFVAHIQQYTRYIVNPVDTVIINEIIGIIDQKTK